MTPILLTKLAIPHPSRTLVERPRLFARLDRALEPGHRLSVLAAPAGYGKTTLVSSWARRLGSGVRLAWLTLDAGDNDPARFWSYLIAAVRQVEANFAAEALEQLHAPAGPASQPTLTLLLNAFAGLEGELVLALDEFQEIDQPAVLSGMQYFIERLPEACHLILLGRSTPALSLDLLRGRGQLLEMRASDLRFHDDEARLLLHEGLGLPLSKEDVRLLNQRAEGWAGGLQLAALSLRGRQDTQTAVREFSHEQRFVADYLMAEVLDRQEPPVRRFLLETSLLETLEASLCAAVLELPPAARPSAQEMLEGLEKANLFVFALDDRRRSYRCHALFAGLLRKRLERDHPAEVPGLQRRASLWYEQHDQAERAVRHALAAGDQERAAALIAAHAGSLWARGEHATLLSLTGSLPEDLLDRYPHLLLYQAGAWVSAGRFRRAEDTLAKLDALAPAEEGEAGLDESLLAHMAGVRALIASYRGRVEDALRYAELARRQRPETGAYWHGYAYLSTGNSAMLAGEFEQAREEFSLAMRAGERLGNPYLYLIAASALFKLAWSRGQMLAAGELIQAAQEYIRAHSLEATPMAGEIGVHAAFSLMERGELEAAEGAIQSSLELALPGRNYASIANMYLILMSCQTARGHLDAAEQTYAQVAALLSQHEVPTWSECGIAGSIACLWVRQGKLLKAGRFLDERGINPQGQVGYPHQAEYVGLAYLLVRRSRLDEAQDLLARLVEYVESTGQWAGMVPILYLQAELQRRQGHTQKALQTLDYAFELAASYGHIQAFFILEDDLLPLMRQAAERRGGNDALLRALTPGPQQPPAASSSGDLVEELSPRELEVLALVAAGLTNKAIAAQLHLALQTVKFHTSNIYAKLGVSNRTQAVRLARELGIIGL